MTDKPTPTDAELDRLIATYLKRLYPQDNQPHFERAIMRAVLAKWGQPAQAAEPSPTAGMNIAQRILHVGGRNNDAGYVEFGSIQAVEALVRQVLRDLPAPATADSAQEDAARSERERICAAIKVEDDYCVEQGDYMLDSDDCIKIARGDWVRPDFSVDAARKQGATQ
jgi:hypothetical protein